MLEASQLRESALWWRLLLLGGLSGFGYAIDLGAGPPLIAFTALLIAWNSGWPAGRRKLPSFLGLQACGWFAAGALPWLALHHAVNYATGGTFRPANAVPEYFNWEGCPFHGAAQTGSWHHGSLIDFGRYAAALLFGKRGFVGHNMALFLLLPAAVSAVGKWRVAQTPREHTFTGLNKLRIANVPVLVFATAWCGATWLLYAATSRNYSGMCCSIRWFVPLLAPAYYAIGAALARWPPYRAGFCLLSGWGLVLMGAAWWYGPWMAHLVPGFWLIQAAALVSWVWQVRASYSKGAKYASFAFVDGPMLAGESNLGR
jgi:hypothetical protein